MEVIFKYMIIFKYNLLLQKNKADYSALSIFTMISSSLV